MADVSTPLNSVSIISYYIFKSRQIESVTIRYLPDKYLVDLGANWVFEEAKDTPLKIKWPFSLMEKEYCGVPNSLIYDSSGMRLDDETVEIVESAYQYNSITPEMPADETKSVSAFKEKE